MAEIFPGPGSVESPSCRLPRGSGSGAAAPDPDPTHDEPIPVRSRAGRHSLGDKLSASLNGWKHALRGDSSFFAHAYRAFLVAWIAGLLGVGPQGWIALVLSGSMLFIAELNHSAIDTLARAIGDPDEPRLKVAREIAAGGVLVAVVGSATVVTVIFVFQFIALFNHWH